MGNKLPQITIAFWCMKIAATTFGETSGNLLSRTFALGYADSSLLLLGLLAISLGIQLIVSKYRPVAYWTLILTVSAAGTTISDYLDHTLALGYGKESVLLIATLLTVFACWQISDKLTLGVAGKSRRAELLYWCAILFSNALGTAIGDALANAPGMDLLCSVLLIGTPIVVLITTHYLTRLHSGALFWTAFVLTRPFGATFGDLLTRPAAKGGFNISTFGVSVALLGMVVMLILYLGRGANRQTLVIRP